MVVNDGGRNVGVGSKRHMPSAIHPPLPPKGEGKGTIHHDRHSRIVSLAKRGGDNATGRTLGSPNFKYVNAFVPNSEPP